MGDSKLLSLFIGSGSFSNNGISLIVFISPKDSIIFRVL